MPMQERPMPKTVADQFAETLAATGVKRVYGIVGDSLNGITDSIRRQGKIEWLHVRHEEVAAFAAGAEAHLTGEIAVCAGSCGPGNLHLINGLFDCHRNRLPILAIAAQIPSYEIGSRYFQETHPEHLFKDCSYYCELISQPEQMPRVLGIAMRTALTKRGVAVVVIPVHNLELRGLAMTHPLKQAESSARKCGGKAEDYLRVHNWFDESKAFLPDFRHRALRHHAEGIFLAEKLFGNAIVNSDGNQVPVRYVGEQHVKEDLGHIPTAQDWLLQIKPQRWMYGQRLDKETTSTKEASV